MLVVRPTSDVTRHLTVVEKCTSDAERVNVHSKELKQLLKVCSVTDGRILMRCMK